MSSKTSEEMGLEIVTLNHPFEVSTASGTMTTSLQKTHVLNMVIYGHSFFTSFILLDMKDFDLILGCDWLRFYHALLDCLG